MRERPFIAVYMMSNRFHGTIYTGVTSALIERMKQHKQGHIPGFTKKYGLTRLVWYEPNQSMTAAINRETTIKKYRRDWKINLIERENPHWQDLYPGLIASYGIDGWPGRAALRSAPPGHDDYLLG